MNSPLGRLVDAHAHVWDSERLAYPWLASVPELPDHAAPDEIDRAEGRDTGMVFVEAGCRPDQYLDEARWVSSLAPRWPELQAVVAGVDLFDESGTAGVDRALGALAELPLVVGVRHVLQGAPAAALSSAALRDALREVARHGLVFDACIGHAQLPALARLLGEVPELDVVLDHLGKPPLAAGIRSIEGRTWSTSIDALAALPNVRLKVSGLSAESPAGVALGEEAAAFVAHAVAAFGAGRSMIGSDWPVSARTGAQSSFAEWIRLVHAAVGSSEAERVSLERGTATAFYRLSAIDRAGAAATLRP